MKMEVSIENGLFVGEVLPTQIRGQPHSVCEYGV